MRVVQLDGVEAERTIDAFGSEGLEALGFVASGRVTFLRLRPGGRMGRHEAPMEQLLLVASGTAEVQAGGQRVCLSAGEAAIFRAGEDHQTASDGGCVAVVVETPDVEALMNGGGPIQPI